MAISLIYNAEEEPRRRAPDRGNDECVSHIGSGGTPPRRTRRSRLHHLTLDPIAASRRRQDRREGNYNCGNHILSGGTLPHKNARCLGGLLPACVTRPGKLLCRVASLYSNRRDYTHFINAKSWRWGRFSFHG